MHEWPAISALICRVESLIHDPRGIKVVRLHLKIGPLFPHPSDHLQELFDILSKGRMTEGALLDIEILQGEKSPLSGEILLESIEVEEP
jgi:Zn finger protein HypA/HybF involved in hydrogenase expression